MSHTLQQHHFNAIIYYSSLVFAMEVKHEAACLDYDKLQKETNLQVANVDLNKAFKDCQAISDNTRKADNKLLEDYRQVQATANQRKLSVQDDLNKVKAQFDKYLVDFADEKFREAITKLISKSKSNLTVVKHGEGKIYIDHGAFDVFKKTLAFNINTNFSSKYKYQEPTTSHFIISFLAHPLVRGLNSLLFLAGLAALTAGILAATGVVTGLPITAASILIAGGAVSGFSGVSLITCSFFRHRSPEELAARCDRLTLPDMASEELAMPANDRDVATDDDQTDQRSDHPTTPLSSTKQ